MIKGIQGHGYYDELVVPIIENTAYENELTDSLAKAVCSLICWHLQFVAWFLTCDFLCSSVEHNDNAGANNQIFLMNWTQLCVDLWFHHVVFVEG